MHYCGQHAHSTPEAAEKCERERLAEKKRNGELDPWQCGYAVSKHVTWLDIMNDRSLRSAKLKG
jgi:hypothetical protein